jgi:hypothetical protein
MTDETPDTEGKDRRQDEPDRGREASEGAHTDVAVSDDVVDAARNAVAAVGGSESGSEATADEPAVTTAGSTDRLFELLASPGNRFVLTYLLRVDDRATYADLVEYVATRTDPPPDLDGDAFRGRVAARLVGQSLPELEEAGLVSRDEPAGVVAATPATDTAAPYLALALSGFFTLPGGE